LVRLVRASGARADYLRSIVAAVLEEAPERNVMGTATVRGAPNGIQKLTCVTPA
jgi:hypothetical protein